MNPVQRHTLTADVSFDGGDLDCGGGLLLLIRQHLDPLDRGGLLEILSTDSGVREDLPAWCRLTGNEFVSWTDTKPKRSFLICKGKLAERKTPAAKSTTAAELLSRRSVPVKKLDPLPRPAPALRIAPLSVMGVGSWPRPRWMLQALHERAEGRLGDAEFQATANGAVRLCVDAQLRAGVDVLTDGEQRRDNYASFVGRLLDNCLMIPLTDLLPLVDNPAEFEQELRALDIPAGEVRHPAVIGPLGRSKPLVGHEFEFVKTLSDKPVKVALPGPYLLTRTMWMECLKEKAYQSREELGRDVVRVLREELFSLLAAGVSLVQFDEPVLSEVVFSGPKNARSFMCGALSERGGADEELAFASNLINGVLGGAPMDRTALHICRGNWTRDESKALRGSYAPLLPLLKGLNAGTYFLELCTPRAGEMEVLRDLPADCRIGVGVVNQKLDRVESDEEIRAKAAQAIDLFGRERVLLNPDCGFATFAENPLSSAEIAEKKLAAIVRVARKL
ncbi:MAG TPA: sulfurtransferase TusA family protein [Planctomycetota bacterium]|nr:sulfurtransferase TusA family protein [Planctomycetota bacterium]